LVSVWKTVELRDNPIDKTMVKEMRLTAPKMVNITLIKSSENQSRDCPHLHLHILKTDLRNGHLPGTGVHPDHQVHLISLQVEMSIRLLSDELNWEILKGKGESRDS
jgi:hypothetical protein